MQHHGQDTVYVMGHEKLEVRGHLFRVGEIVFRGCNATSSLSFSQDIFLFSHIKLSKD